MADEDDELLRNCFRERFVLSDREEHSKIHLVGEEVSGIFVYNLTTRCGKFREH